MAYVDASIRLVVGAHTVDDTTIDISAASEFVAPGVIKVWDASDAKTLKAVISFTGISTNQLTGCVWDYGGHVDVNLANGDFVAQELPASDIGLQYLGANESNVSWLAPPAMDSNSYARKIVVPADGIILSIGAYVQQTVANVPGGWLTALYTHDTDQPGLIIASNINYIDTVGGTILLNATPAPRWYHMPIGMHVVAGSYWAMFHVSADNADLEFGYESGAGTGVSGIITSGSNWLVEKGSSGAGWSTTGNHEYMIRALFQRAKLTS